MKSIQFPEANQVWAKNQPPFLPLPAFTDERETVTCWRLTWPERFKVLLTGTLWLRQMNFGEKLQAQVPTVDRPFDEPTS